jgi:hypothetical protein
MGTSTDDSEASDEFPPEKRLEAPNTRLIKAGIATIPDMETLQECVAYENAHRIPRRRFYNDPDRSVDDADVPSNLLTLCIPCHRRLERLPVQPVVD